MNKFKVACILAGSNQKFIYAKDESISLAGEKYNYLYNQKPRTEYNIQAFCQNWQQKAELLAWLDKYATSVWGFALPILNDAKIHNPGYGIDLNQYFMRTLSEAAEFAIVEMDGNNAKITNNFLTFGNASSVLVRRFVSCILTSDIDFEFDNSPHGAMIAKFSLTEIRQ